jgi:hypothetical protein
MRARTNRRTGRSWRAFAAGAAALVLAGCGLRIGRVDDNRNVTPDLYHRVLLLEDGRSEVLAKLGPPDRILFTPVDEVFEYESEHHRSSDFRIILPTFLLPGPGPGLVLGPLRFFFDPFEEPEEFEEELPVRFIRVVLNSLVGMAPSAGAEDLLTLRGRQLRSDVIRVVVDRESRRVAQKSLQLATGEYEEDSILDRAFLQTD